MTSLRDVMDALAAPGATSLARRTLYGDLAALYAFERERMRDHAAIASWVTDQLPADPTSLVAGACGPGFVLASLEPSFETAVGVDLSPRTLRLAAGRTDAHLVAADLAAFVAPDRFDVYTLLGGSIAHLPVERTGRNGSTPGSAAGRGDGSTDAVRAVLANAYECLRPGGVFVCDFMERGALESGYVAETSFESDRFEVHRTVVTTGTDDGRNALGASAQYAFSYEVTDTEVGDTVRVGTTTAVREFGVPQLLGTALSAGFDDVTLASPPTHGRGLVARKTP